MAQLPRDDNANVSPIVSFNEPVHRSVEISGAATNITADLLVENRMSIMIQADPANTENVYIGFDNTVTSAHNSGTGGYCLTAGNSISIDLAPTTQSKLRDIYAIPVSGTQRLNILEV
jgi:hypothetical protein